MKKRMISALLLLALLAALLPTVALADNTAEAGSAAELRNLLNERKPHITLTSDITLGENDTLTIPRSYTGTIDMAGHTISGGELIVDVSEKYPLTLTGKGVIDCPAELNGTICGYAEFQQKVTLAPNDACKIYGGSFRGDVTTDASYGGSIEIHGGTFYGEVTASGYTTNVYGGVFHKDASFLHRGGASRVVGGVFYKDVTVSGNASGVFAGIFFDENLTARPSEGTISMNVIFDANGGMPQTVTAKAVAGENDGIKYEAPIAPPEDEPTREGYVFTDWYTAPEGGEQFNFDSKWSMDKVREQGELTLYAHWEKAPEEPEETDVLPGLAAGALLLAGSDNPFRDVRAIDWFYGDVMYAYRRGLINGTAYARFNPADTMTRGMLLTILARHDGVKTTTGETWYAAGCDWAVKNGISDGKNPTAPITREELAVILFRYAQYCGKQAMERADLSSYTDAGAVSDYAEQAMQWAVAQAIVRGDNYRLNPQGQTTRAEAAAMLHRFFPS